MTSSDFWVITSFFNPARYKTKRRNFDAFIAGMKAVGANLLVVEMAFGESPFELEAGEHVLQFRGDEPMWQKERLLNVAASRLPRSCRKVGWIDADIIFKEPDWLERTCEALDRHVVVQPFSQAVQLRRGNRDDGSGNFHESFASMFVRNPRQARTAVGWRHGHTGYAWAARRELFEQCGLYDVCLNGGGDHLMAHAFTAAMSKSPCIREALTDSPRYADHFFRWGVAARDLVGSRLGVVPGRILHLWHGDAVDRQYELLRRQFSTLGFDPDKHLRHDSNGMLEWSAQAPEHLRTWARNLFHVRNEDGERAIATPAAS
jgi:hypothetical protein